MYTTSCLPDSFRNVATHAYDFKKGGGGGVPGHRSVSTHVTYIVGGCLWSSTHTELFEGYFLEGKRTY